MRGGSSEGAGSLFPVHLVLAARIALNCDLVFLQLNLYNDSLHDDTVDQTQVVGPVSFVPSREVRATQLLWLILSKSSRPVEEQRAPLELYPELSPHQAS